MTTENKAQGVELTPAQMDMIMRIKKHGIPTLRQYTNITDVPNGMKLSKVRMEIGKYYFDAQILHKNVGGFYKKMRTLAAELSFYASVSTEGKIKEDGFLCLKDEVSTT